MESRRSCLPAEYMVVTSICWMPSTSPMPRHCGTTDFDYDSLPTQFHQFSSMSFAMTPTKSAWNRFAFSENTRFGSEIREIRRSGRREELLPRVRGSQTRSSVSAAVLPVERLHPSPSGWVHGKRRAKHGRAVCLDVILHFHEEGILVKFEDGELGI